MLKLLGPTVKKVEENSLKIEALEKECQKQFSEIDAKIVREVKENTEDIIDKKVKEVWSVEKERAKRVRNIMVTNFKEPDSSVPKEQRDAKDREHVENFFKEHLKLSDGDFKIQNNWRIGKVDQESGSRPRMVKIIMDREYMVSTVLKATKNIQTASDPYVKNVSIFKDLIKEDREQRSKLVTEMKAKNEALKDQVDPDTGLAVTDKWVIRGDRLVYVDKDFKQKDI